MNRLLKKFLNLILVTIFIIVIVVSAGFFIWDKDVNHAKTASFFTIVGSTATALTVFLLYKQISIQYKEYEPKLVIRNSNQILSVVNAHIEPSPKVIITNISEETAHNIQIIWRIKLPILKVFWNKFKVEFRSLTEQTTEPLGHHSAIWLQVEKP